MAIFIQSKISSATFFKSAIFFHWSSSVTAFPSSVDANPHCGEIQIFSSGIYFAASFILSINLFLSSSSGLFDVTIPRTTFFLLVFLQGP